MTHTLLFDSSDSIFDAPTPVAVAKALTRSTSYEASAPNSGTHTSEPKSTPAEYNSLVANRDMLTP
jgi:hypothetical protein